MSKVRVFNSMMFIVHDDNGTPYGTSKEFDKAEKILKEQEEKYGLKGKLNISALGNEITK